MSVLETRADHQQGGIMLMALLILLVVGVLGAAVIELGVMENKSSHYDWEEQQAQQAADAGVEWGMEKIYLELQQPPNLSIEKLPARLACGNAEMRLAGDDDTCRVSIGEVVKSNSSVDEPGSCTYTYTSTGTFRGGRKVLSVQISYCFAGGYQFQDLTGQMSFVPRQYLNRGQIKKYTPST